MSENRIQTAAGAVVVTPGLTGAVLALALDRHGDSRASLLLDRHQAYALMFALEQALECMDIRLARTICLRSDITFHEALHA